MGLDPDRLQEYIEASGLTYRQNSVSFIFDCPRCSKKDKLFIRKRDGRFVCFYCKEATGYQGRPEFALADMLLVPLAQVREALYGKEKGDWTGNDLVSKLRDFFGHGEEPDMELEALSMPRRTWPNDFYPLDHKFAARGVEYLEGRGIPAEVAKLYGIRYAPQRQSIVFPVEVDGRLVGWQTRLVVPTKYWDEENHKMQEILKAKTLGGTPTGRVVMFSDRLKGSDHVVIAEGPFDALACHLCGGNVATMGKGVSPGQVAFLRQRGVKRVYLALDPDASQDLRKLNDSLLDLEAYLLVPKRGYKDLGEMAEKEGLGSVKQLFDDAKPMARGKHSRPFVFFGRK